MNAKNILSIKSGMGEITIPDLDIINFWRYFLLHDEFLDDDIKNTQEPHKRLFLEKAKELFFTENNSIEDLEDEELVDLESGLDDALLSLEMIQELERSEGEWREPEEVNSFGDIPSLLFDEESVASIFQNNYNGIG